MLQVVGGSGRAGGWMRNRAFAQRTSWKGGTAATRSLPAAVAVGGGLPGRAVQVSLDPQELLFTLGGSELYVCGWELQHVKEQMCVSFLRCPLSRLGFKGRVTPAGPQLPLSASLLGYLEAPQNPQPRFL